MWTRRGMIAGLTVAGLAPGAKADELVGDVTPVHDPCVIKADGLYHVFSTSHLREGKGLIHWRTSPDLKNWTFKGAVMNDLPGWVRQAVPAAGGAWAPDIAFVGGRYLLYYSASTFGSNRSVIGLMTTPTLDTARSDFGWIDEGLVVESTDQDRYNAIDPNHIVDEDGRHYLAFGSFWSGLKLIDLDAQTGRRKRGARVRAIAGREPPGAIEAPFVFRRGDFYYLMASYDFCCRGVESSYYTAIGRSKAVEGPYLDAVGVKMTDGGGTVLLRADERFKGPGGGSVFEDGGDHFVVYHAYDSQKGGAPTLRVRKLLWSADGWPTAG